MTPPNAANSAGGEATRITARWGWVGLASIVGLAAWFRLWRLDRNGFGNPYYAAAIRSMLKSPRNLFFGSFDPLGLVAVDKPPVALWIQAASAWAFGYHGLSVLVPQALLGVGCVVLTYGLVRRAFGGGAGLLAGLFVAVTPVSVADDRTNLPDTALVFVLLLGAWALAIALETGRRRWLLLSAVLIGVGYNIKMLAAFLVVPAFAAAYVLAAPVGLWARFGRLACAAVVTAVVSLSWSLAVDLTPAVSRPYLGGSRNNSAVELAMGYNGLERVFGRPGKSVAAHPGAIEPKGGVTRAAAAVPGAGGTPGFDGAAGPLRFAGPVMAGQITWLFPLAILGGGVAACRRPGWRPAGAALVLWLGWLVTHWLVFSLARGVLHEYYTTVMAPAIAALAGAGAVALWDGSRQGGAQRALAPLVIAATVAWQAYVIVQYPAWRVWLLPVVFAGAGMGTAVLMVARLRMTGSSETRLARLAAGAVLASLLVGPVAWSLTPVMARGDSLMPLADPSVLVEGPRGIPLPGRPAFELDARGVRKLAGFLVANRHDEPIAMASMESFLAAPLIIEADLPAVALGGFSGSDRAFTASRFAQMVRQGQVRFVLVAAGQGPANAELLEWIGRNGRPVAPELWRVDEPDEPAQERSGTRLGIEDRRMESNADARAMFAEIRRATRLFDLRPGLGIVVPGAPR
jgi:4-amino-4-deoxy-L-arabinose transferase-like glycosyltransferase